jgi:hypothetical protein
MRQRLWQAALVAFAIQCLSGCCVMPIPFPRQGSVDVDFRKIWDVYPAEYPNKPLKPSQEDSIPNPPLE